MLQNWIGSGILILLTAVFTPGQSPGAGSISPASSIQQALKGKVRFDISFPASVQPTPVTGRVFLLISKNSKLEPRLSNDCTVFGVDVHAMNPGELAVINDAALGFPVSSLSQIPAGDYYVQALLNVYTEFHRADGHVIWAHMDQWEGQDPTQSPGNLISEAQKVHLDSSTGYEHDLRLNKALPPIEVPPDTEWVRHVKFESKLLSRFWGHPIYIGATVLLPKGYESHSDAHYPVILSARALQPGGSIRFYDGTRQGRNKELGQSARRMEDQGIEYAGTS